MTKVGVAGVAVASEGILDRHGWEEANATNSPVTVLSASWFGVKGDGVTDDTAAFQAALNAASGKKLYVPKQEGAHYLTGQLYIPGNIVLELAPGTVIQAVDTLRVTAPYERLIRILNVSNVRIVGNGAVFRMNKSAYPAGEQAHIFDIGGSDNVTIEQVNANDSGGDGFYIGNYQATNSYCRNIVLRDCRADNNRRQGLSVISVDGLLVENCTFTNTIGTNPQAGVDIEPNGPTDRLKKIRLINCVSEGNKGRGFVSMIKKLSTASERIDIIFQNCVSRNNAFGFATVYGKDGTDAAQGEVKYIDCLAEYEKWSGFFELSSSADSVRTTYIRCTAYNCNTNNGTEAALSYAASFFISTVASEARSSAGNSHFYNCRSIDDRTPSFIRRGFATYALEGFTITDLVYRDCESVGHTVSPFEFDPHTRNVRVEQTASASYPQISTGAVGLNRLGGTIANLGAIEDVLLTLPPAAAVPNLKLPYRNANADTTLDGRDNHLIVDASAQPVIVSMPPASTVNGMKFTIKKADSGTNPVQITASGSETIDGGCTVVLTDAGEFRSFLSIGTAWITM
ncbi:right-handed parallel beta-helix repeat-containing protein [Paenibacillus hemerocallicola]|nr:glycosyl hydrolase family 28-related protein [Paenibacillus hemerocallicola]